VNRSFRNGRRVVGLVTILLVGTSLAGVASPSTAQEICPGGPPFLQLANPSPGAQLSQGDYVVSGLAYDPSATQGSGISNVELFLGRRDEGGTSLAGPDKKNGNQADHSPTATK
jgi:hypothetical protein